MKEHNMLLHTWSGSLMISFLFFRKKKKIVFSLIFFIIGFLQVLKINFDKSRNMSIPTLIFYILKIFFFFQILFVWKKMSWRYKKRIEREENFLNWKKFYIKLYQRVQWIFSMPNSYFFFVFIFLFFFFFFFDNIPLDTSNRWIIITNFIKN